MKMSAAVLLLSTSCDALVLGPVLRSGPVASRSGTAQLGFFDDFSMPNFGGRPKPAELVGDVENLADFTDEEMLALKICSVSEEAPCRAGKYQVIENPPPSLLTDTFMELPRSYYDIFRNRRNEPAPVEVPHCGAQAAHQTDSLLQPCAPAAGVGLCPEAVACAGRQD
jgi:hypothetical protein